MGTKEINFVIKVNNKEVDLSKTSFEQFDKVIKQAKKDLQTLPLTDPRYKVLSTDIKNAEASWKAAQKAAGGLNDELDQGDEKIKSYTAEIKKLNLANRELEEQGKKNSKEYEDNVAKIKQLRDAQEEMQRSTQKLDDALSNIPGPIGQIGSSMQQLESVSQSAKSAFKSLGLGFDSFDKIVKTSLVGFLVGLLVTLVGAVMEAAKSFQPLKDAFASMGDAIGQLFNALKPVTDFLLNVFTAVIKGVAFAVSSIAELFGGVDNGIKKQTASLDKGIKLIDDRLKSAGGLYSDYMKGIFELDKKYYEDLKSINENAEIDDKEKQRQKFARMVMYQKETEDLKKKERTNDKIFAAKNQKEIDDILNEGIVIQRERETKKLEIQAEFDKKYNKQVTKELQDRYDNQKAAMEKFAAGSLDRVLAEEQLLYIKRDLDHQTKLELQINAKNQTLIQQQKAEFAREDLHAKNDTNLKTQELTEYLIKNEAEREVKAAKDSLNRLILTQQEELDEIKRNQGEKSQVYKSAKDRQAAEQAQAQEEVRKAELARDVSYYDDAIGLEKSFLSTRAENTQNYFDIQKNLVQMEYDKAVIAADGNKTKILQAENDKNNKLFDLDVQHLNAVADLQERHAQTLNDHTTAYFEAERAAEETAYQARIKAAKDNTDLILIIEEEHQKKLRDLKKSELQAYGETASAVLDSIAAVGNAIASTYDEEAKTSESAFNKRKQLQIATAKMSAASGIIQILTQPSTLPSPFDWITKGLNAAALLIATTAQINTIQKTQFKSSDSGNKPNYGDGGMIDGPRHAEGGVAINAEGGEAVITRGAVTMFRPLLSMMNQMGGGTSFSRGAVGQANFDNPSTNTGSSEQPIIKTYVVSNELTSDAHRAARLKDLSTL